MRKLTLLLLGLLLFSAPLWAQRTITGKVTDDKGNPLPNASVIVKGTTTGTTTKTDGTYSLVVPADAKTLIFSSVDMTAQEAVITSSSSISVSLVSTTKSMEEVVVVAYGTAKKESFTGSANRIDGAKIANRPLTNVGAAIAGAAPGVQTNAGLGQPGSAPAIRVRGFGSINASNDPLFVVDGVPFTASIANINVEDVESISILKDAASTALYGARAANGVVMITTKKGKKGRNQVNVKYSAGVSSRAIPEYDRVNAFQYYPLLWEAYRNSLAYRATNPIPLATASQTATNDIKGLLGYNPFNVANNDIVRTDGTLNPNAQLIYKEEDLDWEKKISRNGVRHDVAVNFSGGQDKTDYFISLGYLDEKAFIIRSDYQRISGRLNVNSQVLPWFKTGLNLTGTFIRSNLASATGGTAFVNPFAFTRSIGPIYPIYAYSPTIPGQYLLDGSGNIQYDFGNLSALGIPNRPGGASGGRHIVAETEWNKEYFRRNVWSARTYGEISFLKDFKFTTNVSVDVTNRVDYDYDNAIVGDGAPGGRSQKTYQTVTSYNINELLNYKKKFGVHNVEALLGHENFDYKDDNLFGFRAGQILDGNIELVNFTTTTSLRSEANFYRVEGYFSRLNYDYDNKYFASVSYRRDGSSKFGKNVRWGDFWSLSGAWRLDRENFIRQISWINTLKLRSSYGETGNDGGISLYAAQPLYTLGFNNALEPGIIQQSLGNDTLEWEANKNFDIGLEFGVLKNRITGSVEYFNRQSDNLIFDVPLPISATGVTSQTRNIGSMYNRGIEVNLGGDVIQTKDFNWNLNINWTTFKNKITDLPQKEIISGTKKLMVGHSLYDYWLRDWQGVDPADGAALYRADVYNPANSRIRGKDDTVTINQNNARFHYAGSAIPDFFGSFTTIFTYKGIELSALFTYQKGGLVYDATWASLMSAGNYGAALHKDMLRRWMKPGDVTDVPRMDVGQTAAFNAASDRWLTDASFINIRNISLSYVLPKTVTDKFKFQGARFFITAENVKMFSKRSGMNVEESFTGVTSNEYVPARIITTGINITL